MTDLPVTAGFTAETLVRLLNEASGDEEAEKS